MKVSSFFLAAWLLVSFQPTGSFKKEQLNFARVREAFNKEESGLKVMLAKSLVAPEKLEIFIRVFKQEGELEVWFKEKGKNKFVTFAPFAICSSSGILGPKRKQGDGQVPEGVYYIDRFNPMSNFYLSLGVSYPNESDKLLGQKGNLGGDIFIHGSCVTIGCMPLEDEIKKVYALAVMAKDAGQQKIPVHIFPFRFNKRNLTEMSRGSVALKNFWENLKPVYTAFETNKMLPQVLVQPDGSYKVR